MVAQADGNALRTERTRNRILAASLALFNAQGEARVSTGAIATAAGISPGNLYYHFRGKDRIVEALFERFEQRVDVQPAPPQGGAEAVEDLWLYLHLMLEAVWEYRFLYRNLNDLVERNPRLRGRFARIMERKSAAIVALCDALVAAGAMRARPGEIRAIARNVLVVATYWLDFRALLPSRAAPTQPDLGLGAHQVMSLFAPYLVGRARRHLEHLSRSYID